MTTSTRRQRLIAAAVGTIALSAAGPSVAQSITARDSAQRDRVVHQFTVETEPLRGATFACGKLTLRAIHGTEIETTEGDLRNGVAHVFISRVWRRVELRGSDGLTYRASGVTAAWFVLHAPDFDTPVHGLEVNQAMFRGGPRKSPGWLRERIKWTDRHATDHVNGPCRFGK